MRRFMIRWERVDNSDDIIVTVGYEFNWFERLTGDRQGPRRFRGYGNSWRHYPGGGYAETWEMLWLSGLYTQLVSWRNRIDARVAREQAALEALKPRPRTAQEITDAEIVAAANEMLLPQSCAHEIDGVRTYKTYDELDQIAQMELGYQVAVAIAAAEKARFESATSPGSFPASVHP